MNLAQNELLLCEQTQDFIITLYRQSKISGCVQINFIASQLGLSSGSAMKTTQFLQRLGFVFYEKYGRITLTDDGKRYAKTLLRYEK